MRVSLKEAHEAAKRSLPGYMVKTEVSIGTVYDFQKDDGEINWTIAAQKKNSKANSMSESDAVFSVALAKLVAEATRKNKKPVEDVDTENNPDTAPAAEQTEEPEPSDDAEPKVDNKDLPY